MKEIFIAKCKDLKIPYFDW